jgi:hypothetical protein
MKLNRLRSPSAAESGQYQSASMAQSVRSALRLSPLALALLIPAVLAVPAKLGNLPVSFEPSTKLMVLNDAGIQKVFPSGNRPDAVLLSGDSKVSMAFEWRDAKLATGDVNTMLAQFPAVIRSQVPGIKTLKQQMVNMNGNSWADFVFVTAGKTAASGDVRREMLITSAQGRMLVLTISSNVADYAKNEADVKAVTSSIRLN